MGKRPHSLLEEAAQSPDPDPNFGVSLSGGNTPVDGQAPSVEAKKNRRSVPKTAPNGVTVVGAEQGSGGSHGTHFPPIKLPIHSESSSPTAQSAELPNNNEPRDKNSTKNHETSKEKHPIGLPPLKRARASLPIPPQSPPSSAKALKPPSEKDEKQPLSSKKGALLGGSKSTPGGGGQPAGLCGAGLPPPGKKLKTAGSATPGTIGNVVIGMAAGTLSPIKPILTHKPLEVIDLTGLDGSPVKAPIQKPLAGKINTTSVRDNNNTKSTHGGAGPSNARQPQQQHTQRGSNRVQRSNNRNISIPNWVTSAASAPIVNDTLLGATARALPGSKDLVWKSGISEDNIHSMRHNSSILKSDLHLPGWEALQIAAATGGRKFDSSDTAQEAIELGYLKHEKRQEPLKMNIPATGKRIIPTPSSLTRHGFNISEFAARFSATAAGLTSQDVAGQTLRERTLRVLRPIPPTDKKKEEDNRLEDPLLVGRALATKVAPLIPGNGRGGRGGGVGIRREKLRPGPKPRAQNHGSAGAGGSRQQGPEAASGLRKGSSTGKEIQVWPRSALLGVKKGDPQRSVSLDYLAKTEAFVGSGLDTDVWEKLWTEKNIRSL